MCWFIFFFYYILFLLYTILHTILHYSILHYSIFIFLISLIYYLFYINISTRLYFILIFLLDSTFPELILRGPRLNHYSGFLLISLFKDLIGNHVKTIFIWYGYLCKYFTIKKQLPLIQIMYRSAITIGYPNLTNCCIYPSNP